MGMIDFTGAELNQMIIHKVGNKSDNQGIVISEGMSDLLDEGLEEVLLKYFLSPFKNQTTLYRFSHETNLNLNEIYMYVSNIFLNKDNFYQESINILKHLYEKSDHPRIKSGEFYLIYFKNCSIEEQLTDVIGIFKSENKDVYLKVEQNRREFTLNCEKGINVKKLDKGCLIFNQLSPNGYKVCIVDTVNKDGEEAQYWKDDFLRLVEIQDDNFHTKTYLNLCKNYCEDVYATLHRADKKDQAAFVNKTLNYFNINQEFDLDQFADEVIEDSKIIESFKNYKQDYEEANAIQVRSDFYISDPTVKTMKKKFKNLIKLDTDVEIKIKNPSADENNTQFIERGYDEEKGMYFYKIFFNDEE